MTGMRAVKIFATRLTVAVAVVMLATSLASESFLSL